LEIDEVLYVQRGCVGRDGGLFVVGFLCRREACRDEHRPIQARCHSSCLPDLAHRTNSFKIRLSKVRKLVVAAPQAQRTTRRRKMTTPPSRRTNTRKRLEANRTPTSADDRCRKYAARKRYAATGTAGKPRD
jgi:hypothetical protein